MIKHNREGESHLAEVMCQTEAAKLWHVRARTIQYHIDRGSLCARKAGGRWIVTTRSLIRLYGLPPGGIHFD
jgi:hypothetical protein